MLSEIRDIDGRLRVAQARARNVGRIRVALQEAEQREVAAHERVRDLLPVVEKESSDVTRLEASQLTQLFLAALGTKEARIARERQEYLAARLKYDEAVLATQGAHLQTERLRETLATLAGAEDEYERLVAHRDALLFESKDPQVAALLGSTAQFGALETETRELVEAIDAGENALGSLDTLSSLLRDTATSDAAAPAIEQLRALARVAQDQLIRFVEELADAGARLQVSLDGIDDLSTFTDAFLEGVVADWIVQSKLEHAASAVAHAADKVSETLRQCRHRLAETQSGVEEMNRHRRETLGSAGG